LAPRDGKLHVLAIGACTNVASALLLEPKIAERIVIVWLGGHAPYWDTANEFNLMQDLHASRILLEAHAPLVLVPCVPVASHLSVTVPELETHLAPFSKLGADLTAIVRAYGNNTPGWSKVIWDIAVTAWLLMPEAGKLAEEPSPVLEGDLTWSHPPSRPKIGVVRSLNRDAIFADFYAKARAHGDKSAQHCITSS
jgi:inosine-uridine nucleoside N-ribohydrolase